MLQGVVEDIHGCMLHLALPACCEQSTVEWLLGCMHHFVFGFYPRARCYPVVVVVVVNGMLDFCECHRDCAELGRRTVYWMPDLCECLRNWLPDCVLDAGFV